MADGCERCALPALVESGRGALSLIKPLDRDAHEGAALFRCAVCERRFVSLWREVGGWEIEDIWDYCAPITDQEAQDLQTAGDPLKAASDLILSRERVVTDPERKRSISASRVEVGIWMHT